MRRSTPVPTTRPVSSSARALDDDGLHPAGALDPYRPGPEQQVQPTRRALDDAAGGVTQRLEVGPLPAVEPLVVDGVQRAPVHDRLYVLEREQLAKLMGGERRVLGPAAPDDPDVGDAVVAQLVEHGARHVRRVQLVGAAGQDARHVDRHVPDADRDHGPYVSQPLHGRVRVARVPGDERPRRLAARQLLAGDRHAHVVGGPHGIDDGVVRAQQVGATDVRAELDEPDEPCGGRLEHLRQRVGDALDRGVVRRDPVPQQPVRRGQPVVQVDRDLDVCLFAERLRGEDARRARPDDRDAPGLRHGRIVRGPRSRG